MTDDELYNSLDAMHEAIGPEIKSLVGEFVRIYVSERMSLHELAAVRHAKLNSYVDVACNSLVLQLATYIVGITKERIQCRRRWPADWWQALKERWFPAWALRRWPVVYDRIDIDEPKLLAVCPHLDAPRGRHLKFLYTESQKA